jgi:uncharacterized delta-60 repeat protein
MRRLVQAGLTLALTLLLAQSVLAHDSGFGLARYSPDGTLDRSFGNGGIVVTRSSLSSFVANALALQPDGKIVVGGMNSNVSSARLELAVARYNVDGTPDVSFSTGGMASDPVGEGGAEANAVVLQPDGMMLVAGTAFSHGASDDEFFVARYTSTGALDRSFGTAGITTTHVGAGASSAAAIVLEPDGHIVVAGTAYSNGATEDDFGVVRYTFTGHLDPSFGNGGIVTTDFSSSDVSLDRATAASLQQDGKIVVAGFTRGDHQSFAAARYNRDGGLDASFGAGGKTQVASAEPQVFSVMLQPLGTIVIAGSSASSDRATAPFTLVRLLPDGRPDELFGSGGVVTTSIEGSRSGARAVVAQPDGKLVTGGARFGAPSAQGDALPNSGFALTRYKADGSIDDAFGSGGKALTALGDAGAEPLALAMQPDGKILAPGARFLSGAQAAHDCAWTYRSGRTLCPHCRRCPARGGGRRGRRRIRLAAR